MSPAMTTLAYMTLFAILIWMPYILAAFYARGAMGVFGYPDNPAPLPGWAERAKKAHVNLTENFAPFAALVVVAEITDADAETVGLWASVFLFARIAHWIIYIMKIPVARTLAFLVGFGAQVMIFLEIAKNQNLLGL